MRIFLWLLTLFATAIGLALTARFNPGNVVLFYPPYRIDISLNFFVLLVLLVFIALHLAFNTIRSAKAMPSRVSAYRKERRERESNRALREALKALFEGRFGHAEKAAKRAAENDDIASIAALIGARAAHHMRQSERRDAWFARIKGDNAFKIAHLMTSIELYVDEQKPERALECVNELNIVGTRNIHAMRLALKANQHAKNWPEVLQLVRSLDKHNALHPALSRRLRELAYEDLLTVQSHDVESIRRMWDGIPAKEKLVAFVAAHAADVFNMRGLHDEACTIVEKALDWQWDERLVRAYRKSAGAEGSQLLLAQIERCEQWSKQRPTDPELALTLGTLCLKQKLWGKAHLHLDRALSDATESGMVLEAHLKLAQLHEALGHSEEASIHFKQCALATLL